jgi:hypothetical protein
MAHSTQVSGEVPRLRSGFRRATPAPRNRLNLSGATQSRYKGVANG